ncbi:MAG TPA: GNAT family N-acetyltransferase [Blastocatellia bacterium]|nr:GNAT family N-acetyltransferase [Blastocatellia bacterium]
MKKVILETDRLILRVMSADDFDALFEFLGDAETMKYYPRPFDAATVRAGIERNLRRFETYGGGLWAVVHRESGRVIGDCGLIYQNVDEVWELEIGYRFNRKFHGQGFATEAARACRDFGFGHYSVSRLISLIRPENLPSRRVAERNGMRIMKETVRADLLHYVYAIERS